MFLDFLIWAVQTTYSPAGRASLSSAMCMSYLCMYRLFVPCLRQAGGKSQMDKNISTKNAFFSQEIFLFLFLFLTLLPAAQYYNAVGPITVGNLRLKHPQCPYFFFSSFEEHALSPPPSFPIFPGHILSHLHIAVKHCPLVAEMNDKKPWTARGRLWDLFWDMQRFQSLQLNSHSLMKIPYSTLCVCCCRISENFVLFGGRAKRAMYGLQWIWVHNRLLAAAELGNVSPCVREMLLFVAATEVLLQ